MRGTQYIGRKIYKSKNERRTKSKDEKNYWPQRVDVDEYHTEFKTVDGFEFLPCDIAPEYLQIDGVDVIPPPVNKGVK